MSYREGGYGGTKLKVGAVVAALVFGSLVLPPVKSWFRERSQLFEMSRPEGAGRVLVADPEVGKMATILRDRYPDDWAALTTAVAGPAASGDKEAVGAAIGQAVGTIGTREADRLATAPHAALARIQAAKLRMFEALASKPRLCAAFANGSFSAADLSPEQGALLGDILAARLLAMADGRDHPVRRAAAAQETAAGVDFVAQVDAQRPGMEARQILTGERRPDQATEEGQCEAGRVAMRAFQAMPAERGDPIFLAGGA